MSDAAAQALRSAPDGFLVGRVLSRSLALLVGRFPTYFAFGVAMALIDFLRDIYAAELGQLTRMYSFAAGSGEILLSVIVFNTCEAAMVSGALRDLQGRRFEIGTSLREGLRQLAPALGTSICAFAIVAIGMCLAIIPGLIAISMLFVVVPVCVAERREPLACPRRSYGLTKGYRLRVLAAWLVPAIAIALCNLLVRRVGSAGIGFYGFAAASLLLQVLARSY